MVAWYLYHCLMRRSGSPVVVVIKICVEMWHHQLSSLEMRHSGTAPRHRAGKAHLGRVPGRQRGNIRSALGQGHHPLPCGCVPVQRRHRVTGAVSKHVGHDTPRVAVGPAARDQGQRRVPAAQELGNPARALQSEASRDCGPAVR